MGCDDFNGSDNCSPPDEDALFASLRHGNGVGGNTFVVFRYSYSPRVLVQIRKLEKVGPRNYTFEGETEKREKVIGRAYFSNVSPHNDSAELKVGKAKAKTA